MKQLEQNIIQLRSLQYTYEQIATELLCSKSTVCYYLNKTQKQKVYKRTLSRRNNAHPYSTKLENFLRPRQQQMSKGSLAKWQKLLNNKIQDFFRDRYTNMYTKPTFSIQDIIDKFGENPKCYLTGEQIDIYQPKTYSFDHKIPASRGGENTIENLGVCTKKANLAKSDMTPDEFIAFCKKVVTYHQSG